MSLGAMDIFKFLPAGKRDKNANCKKCGCPTCMMFAIKLSKGQESASKCPFIPFELASKLEHNKKIQQKTLVCGNLKIGGEVVLYRHEKTFVNPSALVVMLDSKEKNYLEKLKRVLNFEIDCIGKKYKIDAIYSNNLNPDDILKIKNKGIEIIDDNFLTNMYEVKYTNLHETVATLTQIRKEAIVERNEKYSNPTFVRLHGNNFFDLCSTASVLICKYSNMLIFEHFDEALFSSLITLRLNIFTDPQKPLQVESKVYEFNNPDQNALVFLTTNFALSYFAVANELSSLKYGSYLVITPSEGMSVLTAWSAQKITAEIAARVISSSDKLKKVKNKRIIIPGLLYDLKSELEQALPEWKITIGTTEAYKIPEFVKKLQNC